jgi:ubiquinone/menaquinone biosynthesis methyltransferase
VSLQNAFDTPYTKRRYVRRLFHTIAPRYDLITRVLSYGQDARWKQELVRRAALRPGDRALDLACGTGDIATALATVGARVTGLDITPRMLLLARAKDPARGVSWVAGDMAALPFASESFDAVTTGYGLRNVPVLDAALREIARVLRPGGMLASLDFNRPANPIVRAVYLTYLTVVGSALGLVLHRDPDTYRYIPESIRRYPGSAGVAEAMIGCGFDTVGVVPVLGGLMTIHIAKIGRKNGVHRGSA